MPAIGRTAAERVFARLEGQSDPEPQQRRTLPTRLIVRGSGEIQNRCREAQDQAGGGRRDGRHDRGLTQAPFSMPATGYRDPACRHRAAPRSGPPRGLLHGALTAGRRERLAAALNAVTASSRAVAR